MTTPTAAASAYSALARITDAANPVKPVEGSNGPSFGSMLNDAVSAFGQITHKADAQSQALAAGKANIIDVVTAVAESETAIDTLVSVRDRVIQSYEEIMKMPI